jgi:site-specific recombinase XerD
MEDLPQFCQRFLNYCNVRLTKLTACGYLYEIRKFFEFHASQIGTVVSKFTIEHLDKIKCTDIESWLATFTKLDMNSICRKRSSLQTFLEYYYQRREIQQNAAAPMLMPKLKEKPIKRLTHEEVSRLLAAVTPDNRHHLRDLTILVFFLSTGVRISELIGLDIKHLDMINASFVVTRKGGKVETLYMTEDLQIQLMYYLDSIDTDNPDTPLFASEDNPRISDVTVRDTLRKYVKIAGLPTYFSPHKLRSTFGTNLYRKTRDIFAVAQVLGHSSVNTTRKHYVAMDEDIKRAAIQGYAII